MYATAFRRVVASRRLQQKLALAEKQWQVILDKEPARRLENGEICSQKEAKQSLYSPFS